MYSPESSDGGEGWGMRQWERGDEEGSHMEIYWHGKGKSLDSAVLQLICNVDSATMAMFSNNYSSSASFKNKSNWDFSGGPVIKIPHSQCWGQGFDTWSGN